MLRYLVVKLVVWTLLAIGLIELFSPRELEVPRAELWAAVASETGPIDTAIFSPDGRTLATVDSHGHAELWDVSSGQRKEVQPIRFDRLRAIAYSPDGRMLAGGTLDSTILLWNLDDLEVCAEIQLHDKPVNALAFSPDGRMLASAGGDGALVFWCTVSGTARRFSIGSFSSVIAMAFSPDGTKLATSHLDREVRIRETASPGFSTLVARFSGMARALAFSPDGRVLASSVMLSSQISRWGPVVDCQRATSVGPDSGSPALAFSPDGCFTVTAGRDGLLQLRDESVDTEWTIPTGHSGRVWSLAFSPDGRSLITGGNDGVIRLWDVGKLIPLETEKLGLLHFDVQGHGLACGESCIDLSFPLQFGPRGIAHDCNTVL